LVPCLVLIASLLCVLWLGCSFLPYFYLPHFIWC
jgi:hypothetical protein